MTTKGCKHKYVVFDVETTTKSPVGFPASPFHPDNEVVLWGALYPNGTTTVVGDWTRVDFDTNLIVGHNVKFDIHHLCKASNLPPRTILRHRDLWDTSVAEFILSRQRMMYPTLDACALKRGGRVKDDAVSALIKSGVDPKDIEPTMLAKYLRGDLENTEIVFLSQYAEAKRRGMLPLIWAMMRSVKATCEMEWNGLDVDLKLLHTFRAGWEKAQKHITTVLDAKCAGKDAYDYYKATPEGFNWDSPRQVSQLLFGGSVLEKVKEADGFYKNGNPKFKTVEKALVFKGFGHTPNPKWATKVPGVWSVDDHVLKELLETHKGTLSAHPCGFIIALREYAKLVGTYADGINKHIFPDGKIHGTINHVVARTGRLSSSNPNLQNMTHHEFRSVFSFKDHTLLEIDYKQLEMVALAVLSKDARLMDDITSGKDMHEELYKDMHGVVPTKEQRKPFKRLSFGLVYGAGARTLAENSGCSLTEARKFISTFYARYPGVKLWHDQMIQDAKEGREGTNRKDSKGTPLGRYVYRLPTGREFEFWEYESTFKPGEYGFSPTELKNYPVQGFATGDLVPLMLGVLAQELWNSPNNEKVLLLNTVHDSVLFAVREGVDVGMVYKELARIMERTDKWCTGTFGVNPGMTFSVSGEMGGNWFNMEELEL